MQLLGWAILVVYFVQTPIIFNAWWVLAYIAIFIAVTVVYVVAIKPVIDRFVIRKREPETLEQAQTLYPDPKNAPVVSQILRRPWRMLLAPGEDGVFFVPVALLGVTWWAALVASALFGLAHYKTYSTSQCAIKGVCAFLCCLVVLPHGMINFVVGHLVLDVVAATGFVLSAWKDGLLAQELSANPGPQPTPTNGAAEPER